jgi:outer membrane protein assembly factor BamE (lipoprotein component of BamABCDE complex)
MTNRLLICALTAMFSISGCGLIYKQNIQQGNAIEQDDLDELYVGMNKRQVLFVLGTPSVQDPFNQDRWDYVQTFSRRGGPMVQRTVTLRFDDDVLGEVIGLEDPFAGDSASDSGEAEEDVRVTVSQVTGTNVWPPFNPDLMPNELRFVPIGGRDFDDDDEDEGDEDEEPGTFEPLILEPEDKSLTEPDIEALREKEEETKRFEDAMDVLDQGDDDAFGPDIDN